MKTLFAIFAFLSLSAPAMAAMAPMPPHAPRSAAIARPPVPDELSLDALIDRALKQVPSLQAAAQTAVGNRERIGVARSNYLPQVNGTASADATTFVTPAFTVSAPILYAAAGASAHQELFNFGKTDAQVAAARATYDASRYGVDQTAADVAFNVRQVYMNWVQALGLLAESQEQFRNAQALYDQALAFFKAGTKARYDVTAADVAVKQAQSALVSARVTLEQAKRSMETAVGDRAPIVGTPGFPPVPRIAAMTLPTLQSMAFAQNPTLLADTARATAAKANADVIKASELPDLAADGSVGGRYAQNGLTPTWMAGLSLGVPLFTGFSLQDQAAAADADYRAALATVENDRQQVNLAVDNAYLGLTGARDAMIATHAEIGSAKENLRQANGRYQAGVGSIIDVSSAQTALATAEADDVRARTSYHLAIAALIHAIGLARTGP